MVPIARSQSPQELEMDPSKIALVLTLAALLLPAVIMTYSFGTSWFQLQIYAMVWSVYVDPYGANWMVGPFAVSMMLPMTFLRIVFVVMVMRAYQRKTTRKRATITGVAAELQMPFIYYGVILLVFMITSYYPGGGFMMILPIPILLALGIIIMRMKPPPGEPTKWKDDDRQGYWWEEEEESEDSENESKDKIWFQD